MFTLRVAFVDPLTFKQTDLRRVCKTLPEAVSFWTAIRNHCDLGASHMTEGCGDVFVDGKCAYRISYNGRVWDLEGKEVLL